MPNETDLHLECSVLHSIPIDILYKEEGLCHVLLGNLSLVLAVEALCIC